MKLGKRTEKMKITFVSNWKENPLLWLILLRPLFCPTKKYNSIHVPSYTVSHKKTAHWHKTTTNIHKAVMSYLIKQNWSHFFSEKCKSKQNNNNRRDAIIMIQVSLSFFCNVDERNRCGVSLQFSLVFRLVFTCRSPKKHHVTLHSLQKCTWKPAYGPLLHYKIVFFHCVLYHIGSSGKGSTRSQLLYNV